MSPPDENWDDILVILEELDERTEPSGPPPLDDPDGSVLWEMTSAPTRKVEDAVIRRILREGPP